MPSRSRCFVLAALAAAPAAQSVATVPPVCRTLPGNAAVSMPLRWSQGVLQVFVDAPLLPTALTGQTITGLRLRRTVLPGAGPDPAMTRTLTVRGAFQPWPAAGMIGSITANRPPNTQVLFGPAPVAVPATPAPGPATTVGDDVVQIVFSQGLPVTAGTLFLEFEAGDGPLQVGTGHWIDAVWFENGVDQGLAVVVGDGSCTTLAEPTELRWTAPYGPVAGTSGALEVRGAPPTTAGSVGLVLVWAGIDPETRGPGAGYLGYGASFVGLDPGMAGCHQWAPFDVAWSGTSDPAGTFATSVDLPSTAAVGQRIALQAAWLDVSRPVLPLSFSNGLQLVCTSAGVQDRCSSLFFPGTLTNSPFGPFRGQMPVLRLEY